MPPRSGAAGFGPIASPVPLVQPLLGPLEPAQVDQLPQHLADVFPLDGADPAVPVTRVQLVEPADALVDLGLHLLARRVRAEGDQAVDELPDSLVGPGNQLGWPEPVPAGERPLVVTLP